jgi:uncharacterized 2Fe-2S/4Fe-4S cluster protein (DUF4445 family)
MGEMTVIFEPEGRRVTVSCGVTLLQAANEAGIRIRSECGGSGTCGKCHVIIEDQQNLNEITNNELALLSPEEIRSGHRLACCTKISRNSQKKIAIMIPRESRMLKRKFQATGIEVPIRLAPSIKKYYLSLVKPTLQDIRADLERLQEALEDKYSIRPAEIDYELLKNLPRILRDANWDVTVTVWNNHHVVSIEAGDTTKRAFGLAIDIGTSKIVSHLVDLLSGETLAIASVDNPQTMHGEDIITRIAFIGQSDENLRQLQRLVVDGINETIRELNDETGNKPEAVYEATVVGNTAMHHIFLGIRPRFLGLSPFTPAVRTSVTVNSRELGVNLSDGSKINVLPVIAGFVGADAVADMIASGIYDMDGTSLLVDIGTNTEVILCSNRDILSCSCASGPAFEGAHISQGMKAVTGAIDKVWIEYPSSDIKYSTIDDAKPLGLCGSAIIDVVAEMFRHGIISSSGRFKVNSEDPRLKRIGDEMRYVVAWKHESGTGRDIAISEKDVNEIQLAKAAIFAGVSILMKRKHVCARDLDRLMIAGAFGNQIDYDNAKMIGLIPDIPNRKIEFIGNAAVAGAKAALLSTEIRDKAELISRKVRYLELTIDPDFRKEFMDALYLPHRDASRFPNIKSQKICN